MNSTEIKLPGLKSLVWLAFLNCAIQAAPALNGGLKGTGRMLSGAPLDQHALSVGIGFARAAGDRLKFYDDTSRVAAGEASLQDVPLAVSYAPLRYLELGLFLPLHLDTYPGGKSTTGAGDLSLSIKLNYPPYIHPRGFDLSYLLRLHLPTGGDKVSTGYTRHVWHVDNEDPQDISHYSAKGPVLEMRLLNTADFSHLDSSTNVQLHLNWGLVLSPQDNDNAFVIGGGISYAPIEYFDIFWGFDSEVPVGATRKRVPLNSYPIRSSFGIEGHVPQLHNLTVATGLDFTINPNDSILRLNPANDAGLRGYSRVPDLGWFLELSSTFQLVPPDSDGDGIRDPDDACPREKEDFDGFEDEDGCPDLDNDGDGIADVEDKCPLEPEDLDGFEDEDGCPDLDNDGDGIPDLKDACPMEKEDFDGYEDADGCPDPDNDGDGIPDITDRCPDEPEDKDGRQDADGCPDGDEDGDGILDEHDKCPTEPETFNGYQDEDGCPDSAIRDIREGRYVVQGLGFKTGTSELTFQSTEVLDSLAAILKAYPATKVGFHVYAKKVGSEDKTVQLTGEQAQVLKNFLVSKGVLRSQIPVVAGEGSREGIEGRNIYRVEIEKLQ